MEKLILVRIQEHHQQSGLRSHRQTKDNLLFLIQKIQETFTRKKKVICFFFDIAQAFDKVWHNGLISKLIKINLPHYLVKWISYYLKERDFCVKIGEFQSEAKPIRCGVPQGAVLSPTLFSIYINDTPILYDKNKAYSLLFADDLATFFIFKKINKTESRIRTYMKQLEIWLGKWRLTMHAKKCNQMIFKNNSKKNINKNHSFKLYNETIPACETLKFLVITFDLGVTFKEQVKKKGNKSFEYHKNII